jgi:CheY-like chemotaxis protein
MPKINGVDLAKFFLQTRPDLPILITTGDIGKYNREDLRSLGIRDIVLKPVGIRDLGEKITTALNPEQKH